MFARNICSRGGGREVFPERNDHRHRVLVFTGLTLTGPEDIVRLAAGGHEVDDTAYVCFSSVGEASYDARHRLVGGQEYRVAVVPGSEIESGFERTTDGMLALGASYGYGTPLAGLVPRVREVVTKEEMEELRSLISLHDLIPAGDEGLEHLLQVTQAGVGCMVCPPLRDPGKITWPSWAHFLFPIG